MFQQILDLLKRKVQEGVEVRLIYDDVGSLTTLPYHFEKNWKRWVYNVLSLILLFLFYRLR